jgi:hypothetical protein
MSDRLLRAYVRLKALRELWVRNNFQVVPEEWSKLVADLEHTGRASIERSAGKLA